MVCSKCHKLSDFEASLFNGPVPPACTGCEEDDEVRALVNKRSHGIGRLRPRMVLYNEHNPDDEAIGSVTSTDLRTRPDAVIVAGTTLKVPGVRRIVREMCGVVRSRRDGLTVWINNDPEPIGKDLENSWDLIVRGPCDEVARYAGMRKWDDTTEFKEVTEEELRRAKENTAEVVVVSPKKPKAIENIQGQLITPVASPRMAPRVSIEPPPSSQDVQTPTKKRKMIPTSKAKALIGTLDMKAAPKPVPKKRGPKPKATGTNTTKAPRATKKTTKATKPAANNKITTAFTVSKAATKPKQNLKLKMGLPDKTSQPEESINVSPRKLVAKAIEIPVKTDPMAPISPHAARNNSSPPIIPQTPSRPHSLKFITPHRPTPEPFTPVHSRMGTISPTGTLPKGLAHMID